MPDLNIMPKAPAGNRVDRVRALLQSPDTFGTTMLLLCVDAWGGECLHDPDDPTRGPWHPATFREELTRKFGVQPTRGNLDRLMAAVTVVTTDLFFTNAASFVTLANVLAGDEFDPEVWEKADSVECAWAITEALMLDPPDDDNPNPFSDEVRHYVGAVLRDEGYVTPPDVLKIALDADFADKVSYAFGDDPEMFEGVYAVQQGKADDVEAVLRDRLLDLRGQIDLLPLNDGQTAELSRRIAEMLKLNEPEEPAGPESLL